MHISKWKIFLFCLVIITGTWFVFPGPRTLVMLYIQEEKQDIARPMLQELMAENPNDLDLLMLAADFYQADGSPDLAIDYLSKAVAQRPDRVALLVRLADWMEWANRPDEAIATLERAADIKVKEVAPRRILEANTNKRAALQRLLDHYRYVGNLASEAWTSARLVHLEQVLPVPELNTDIAVRAVTAQMLRFAERIGPNTGDAATQNMLTQLHLSRQLYVQDLVDSKGSAAKAGDFVADIMDRMVRGGFNNDALTLAQEIDSASRLTISRLALARTLRWYGNDAAALPILAQIRKENPGDKEAMDAMAEIKSSQGGFSKADQAVALKDLQQLHANNPKDTDVTHRLADALLAEERPKEAFAVLQEIPVQNAEEAKTLIQVAGATRQPEAVAQAAENAKPLLAADKDLQVQLADAWLSANQPARAWPVLRDAASANSNDLSLVRKALEAAASTDNPKIMQEALGIAEQSGSRDPSLLLDVAKSLVANEQLDRAAKVYERYLTQKPDDQAASLQYADVQTWRDQPGKALDVLKKLLKRKPGDKLLLTKAATLAEAADKSQDAYSFYAELSRRDPKDMKVREKYVQFAQDTGHTHEIVKLLAGDSDKDPGNFKKARQAADAYLAAEEPAPAAIFLERALAQKPDDVPLRRELASTYGWASMGDKQAKTLEPLAAKGLLNDEETVFVAGRLAEKRQYAKVIASLQKYESQQTLPWEVGLLLVQAYDAEHRNDQATKILKRLQKDAQGDPVRLSVMGETALGMRRNDLALDFFQAALKRDPHNTAALKGAAQIYAANNDPQRAIRNYEAVKARKPHDIEARYQLGELYNSSETPEAAYGEYQKALDLIKKARKALGNNPQAGKGEP